MSFSRMITIQLTKLESALDQVRKTYTKLVPADAALLATALSLTGRHAVALYEGEQYVWPEDNEKLTKAMLPQIAIVQEAIEANAPKKVLKNAPEEEPVTINVGLAPNISAGEKVLIDRDDLKTLLSDVISEGVEFAYNPGDIGWQWALDRANWQTLAEGDVSRRIKIKTVFTEGAVGIELGATTKKRTPAKKAEVVEVAEPAEAIETLEA